MKFLRCIFLTEGGEMKENGKEEEKKKREKLPLFILNDIVEFCIMDTLLFFTGDSV